MPTAIDQSLNLTLPPLAVIAFQVAEVNGSLGENWERIIRSRRVGTAHH